MEKTEGASEIDRFGYFRMVCVLGEEKWKL